MDDISSVISSENTKRKHTVESINCLSRKKKKKSLKDLKENARKGDKISSKIYKHL